MFKKKNLDSEKKEVTNLQKLFAYSSIEQKELLEYALKVSAVKNKSSISKEIEKCIETQLFTDDPFYSKIIKNIYTNTDSIPSVLCDIFNRAVEKPSFYARSINLLDLINFIYKNQYCWKFKNDLSLVQMQADNFISSINKWMKKIEETYPRTDQDNTTLYANMTNLCSMLRLEPKSLLSSSGFVFDLFEPLISKWPVMKYWKETYIMLKSMAALQVWSDLPGTGYIVDLSDILMKLQVEESQLLNTNPFCDLTSEMEAEIFLNFICKSADYIYLADCTSGKDKINYTAKAAYYIRIAHSLNPNSDPNMLYRKMKNAIIQFPKDWIILKNVFRIDTACTHAGVVTEHQCRFPKMIFFYSDEDIPNGKDAAFEDAVYAKCAEVYPPFLDYYNDPMSAHSDEPTATQMLYPHFCIFDIAEENCYKSTTGHPYEAYIITLPQQR